MDEQDTVLEQEVLESDPEEMADGEMLADEGEASEDVDPDSGEEQEELEYDEDGNVVEDVAEEDEPVIEETIDGSDENGAKVKEKSVDEEAEALRRELDALRRQSTDTLKKLGVNSEDPMEGLESLAADADGVTLEEYRKKKSEAERSERANRLLEQQEFEKLAAQDLVTLQSDFPETRAYKSLTDMPTAVLQKFGKFREMGLTAKEAYAAANPDEIRQSIAASVKKQSLHESKGHLRTTVPKAAKNTEIRMTRAQLEEYRGIFPGYSDKRIISLYKEVTKK